MANRSKERDSDRGKEKEQIETKSIIKVWYIMTCESNWIFATHTKQQLQQQQQES